MKSIAVFLLAACALWCAAGCASPPKGAVVQRRSSLQAPNGDHGVRVDVMADGTLLLYREPISRQQLVKRLINEEGGMRAERMVVLEGAEGVSRARLDALRDYLVKHRIPRVTIATPRAFRVEGEDTSGPIRADAFYIPPELVNGGSRR